MNHEQRIEAAHEVSRKLLQSHPEDIVAIGVLGSVAREEDGESSDIDMHVLVKEGARLSSHFFILDGCYYSIVAKTENEWIRELSEPVSGLCLTAGAFQSVLILHDPSEAFSRLRRVAEALPSEAWRMAVREGIAGIVEDLGRVRNFFQRSETDNFRLFAVLVGIGTAKVYGDLGRRILRTEKELNTAFEIGEGRESMAARAYRKACRLVDVSDQETMEALEWLYEFLTTKARAQDAIPETHKSAKAYSPP